MTRDDDIVGYLLGELAPADRRRVERAMGDDPALRDEVERMRPLVAALEATPPEAWDDDPVPALPPLPPLGSGRTPRRWAWRPAIALAVAVIAVAAIVVGVVDRAGDQGGGPVIALARIGDGTADATGTARETPSRTQLRVQVSGLRPSSRAQFYELWLLDGPTRAVSLGAFRVPDSGAASVTVPLPVSLADFRFIDVSVEPEDGVATHSGHSVLRAPTTI